jgi:hypothetical protein
VRRAGGRPPLAADFLSEHANGVVGEICQHTLTPTLTGEGKSSKKGKKGKKGKSEEPMSTQVRTRRSACEQRM